MTEIKTILCMRGTVLKSVRNFHSHRMLLSTVKMQRHIVIFLSFLACCKNNSFRGIIRFYVRSLIRALFLPNP